MTCLISGCDREVVCRGLCKKHYDRLRRHGSPELVRMSRACLACGRFFETTRRDKAFCSHRCRARFQYARSKDWRLDREPNPLRTVSWEAAEPDMPQVPQALFTLSDVWKHSRGECHECGEPVDLDADALSLEAPVGTWIVPPDVGGEVSLENRVLVHRRCLRR